MARRAARRAEIAGGTAERQATTHASDPVDADNQRPLAVPSGDPPTLPAEGRSGSGQVVTIRANRATPPLAERADPVRRPPAADVEEGVVTEPRPLRPAMQARPPRRRRYGNRG